MHLQDLKEICTVLCAGIKVFMLPASRFNHAIPCPRTSCLVLSGSKPIFLVWKFVLLFLLCQCSRHNPSSSNASQQPLEVSVDMSAGVANGPIKVVSFGEPAGWYYAITHLRDGNYNTFSSWSIKTGLGWGLGKSGRHCCSSIGRCTMQFAKP